MMHKVMAINRFGYGLMTEADPRALPVGAAQVAENVLVERGDVRVRPGRVVAARCPAGTTGGVRSLGELVVAGHAPAHRFVAVIGNGLYWSVDAATAPARMNTTLYALGQCIAADGRLYECTTAGATAGVPPVFNIADGAATTDGSVVWTRRAVPVFQEIDGTVHVSADHPVRMHQYADKLYLVDGTGPVLQLDADGHITALTEFPAPTTAPAIVQEFNTVTVDDAVDGTEVFGAASATGRYRGYLYGAPSPILPHQWLHDGSVSDKNIWHAYVGNRKGPGSLFPNHSEVMGATARQLRQAGHRIDGQAASIALELCAQPGTATMSCGDIAFLRKCDAKDFSGMSSLTFTLKVISGTGSAEVPASLDFVCSEDGSTWTTVPVDLTGLTNEAEFTATVDLTGVPDAAIDTVTCYGLFFGSLELDVADRVEVTNGHFCYPNTYETPDVNATKGAYIVLGPITGNVPGSTSTFLEGTYELSYTYYTADDESAEYTTGAFENLYPSLVLGAALPQSLTITGTKDGGSRAVGMRVYARTPATGAAFRRIGEAEFGSGATAQVSWDGAVAADAAFLEEYVGTPPAGATLLCTWRNRMVYVARAPGDGSGARDVLYFSNFGDPTRVPTAPSALQQVPATYGGWADLERIGSDVTGLAVLGSVLAAFKASALFAVSGDPGQADFQVQEITRTDGCLSHESIRQAGGQLIWQARDRILAWGGGAVEEVSAAIAPTVRAISAAHQAAAYAVYDPQTRRYALFYGEGEVPTNGGAAPEGRALVLQLQGAQPAWCRWTRQPDACGLYSAHASVPGVYLCDRHNSGMVFLLDKAATTDAVNVGAAEAIDWAWVSGELPSPFAGRRTAVAMVRALAQPLTGAEAGVLRLNLWPNNDPARTFGHEVALAGPIAQWQPAPRVLESVTISLGRGGTAVAGVREVRVVLSARGLLEY